MKADGAWVLATSVSVLIAAAPAVAHHSFAAQYDNTKPVTLTGTVTKLEWMNPHARFYIDVKNDKGAVTNWEFELGNLNALIRAGWKRDSLKSGDVVTVDGFLARDGSPLVNATTVIMSDGRKVFAGSPQTARPPRE